MKVLFTHSYFLHFDKKQLQAASPYPPLALLYAAAVLRDHGHEVHFKDLQFARSADEIRSALEIVQPDLFVIYDDSFNYLTKMCLSNMRDACFQMQAIAKKLSVPVAVSSSDATDHLSSYFDHGTDYIIIGEAENTLLELVNNLSAGVAIEKINGLAFTQGKEIIRTPVRNPLKNLDVLPSPAWDLVDFTPYKEMWRNSHGYFSINLVTTRGCPYKCNWCAKPVYGNRYNSHSPARIVQEITNLQKLTGFEHIWFADDIFGLKPGWLKEFRDEMKTAAIPIRYKIQSRADLLVEEETVRALKESGCEEVWLGAESGSQKILDAMDKGTTVVEIAQATALLKKYHIKPCFFLQFGYPDEHATDIAKTLKMLNELRPHDIGISVSYPLPGTKFYDRVVSEMEVKKNWTDSDDLHLMFRGTYPPQFYRQLQKYVHYQFRASQSARQLKKIQLTRRSFLFPYYFIRQTALKRKIASFGPEIREAISLAK